MKLLLNPEFNLYEKNGQAFCDSLQVAETFEKRHADVLSTIGKMLDPENGLSEDFRERNFSLSSYQSEQNKKMPKYYLTKDGFTILTFGYSGKKAMAFKESYITRFNQMEQFIASLSTAKMEFPAFTEAIMLAHDEPKHYHFSNEINMIYKIVLGIDAKAFRKNHGLKAGEVIRPYLSFDEIKAIETLQRVDIGLHEAVLTYDQRKAVLTNRFMRDKLLMLA